MDEFIKYKIIDHIAWITMKRNPSNAFNIEFLDEIFNKSLSETMFFNIFSK